MKIIVLGGMAFDMKYDSLYKFYSHKETPGINSFTNENIIEQIKTAKNKYGNSYIIVYPHWLENYKWKTDQQTLLSHAMIDAGADLILGHGTHMLQEIEKYKNKWIIYSLGNFVFNSPGRYSKAKIHPYSAAANLVFYKKQGQILKKLHLYPILSDNKIMKYQPRFLTKVEMDELKAVFEKKSVFFNKNQIHKDKIGYYISLNLK